jgi:hypothetical protein
MTITICPGVTVSAGEMINFCDGSVEGSGQCRFGQCGFCRIELGLRLINICLGAIQIFLRCSHTSQEINLSLGCGNIGLRLPHVGFKQRGVQGNQVLACCQTGTTCPEADTVFAVWLGWTFRTTVGTGAGVAAEPQALRVRAITKMDMTIKVVFFILKSHRRSKSNPGRFFLFWSRTVIFNDQTIPQRDDPFGILDDARVMRGKYKGNAGLLVQLLHDLHDLLPFSVSRLAVGSSARIRAWFGSQGTCTWPRAAAGRRSTGQDGFWRDRPGQPL